MPRSWNRFRWVEVPERAAGLRLDRFLALRFRDRSRTALVRGIKRGQVRDADGQPLRASTTLRGGERLKVTIPGIAPTEPPPPLPVILHEDDRVVVVDKPAGMLAHPTGTAFAWAVVGLARERWPEVDLVHRLDRDTSGTLVLSKDRQANVFLKEAFKRGEVVKEYEALARGHLDFDHRVVDAPIGSADGPIRIQMAVRDDGLDARTDVTVLGRTPPGVTPALTRVRCRLHTGRTHQIRVHLAHVGAGLVGDRMYGVPPEVFLHAWEHGPDAQTFADAGAPRHALHAASIAFPHPAGGTVHAEAPFPEDLTRWWQDPSVLPLDDVPRGTPG